MRKLDYIIRRIPDYPDDGTHMQVHWDLPIEVVKGVDGFVYYSPKGVVDGSLAESPNKKRYKV
jgi:hypothetical protein